MKNNINIVRPNVWVNQFYKINGLVTQSLIKDIISKFWDEVMMTLANDQYVIFILKARYTDGDHVSLSQIQKVNKDDLDKVLENFIRLSDIKLEDYFNSPVDQIIISYKLISNQTNKFKIIINKFTNSLFYKGLVKGNNVPLLPSKVSLFYSNIFIRILRVIGGFCFILLMSSKYKLFPDNIQIIIIILGNLQIWQVIFIFLFKSVYGIYILKYKPELFEVRNSPLSVFATQLAKAIYCAKIGCGTIIGAGGLMSAGLTYDQTQVKLGNNEVFMPSVKRLCIKYGIPVDEATIIVNKEIEQNTTVSPTLSDVESKILAVKN